jgi:hypothetical protein
MFLCVSVHAASRALSLSTGTQSRRVTLLGEIEVVELGELDCAVTVLLGASRGCNGTSPSAVKSA